ncbi:MAG: response regulator [Elusimicrobiales bacterium]|nr:response regulator [Elusimicrobiales bacterium]
MRVLLIEDNALTRYTIKSLLDKLGHEVVAEAEDAQSALKCFKEFKPDVVFLDLILPGKSGVEILEDLRAADPAVRVVVVTAVEQEEIDRRLADKGVSAILRKPFSYEDFKTLMKDFA